MLTIAVHRTQWQLYIAVAKIRLIPDLIKIATNGFTTIVYPVIDDDTQHCARNNVVSLLALRLLTHSRGAN